MPIDYLLDDVLMCDGRPARGQQFGCVADG